MYGVAQPGELLAIMGGSGAGKTTLMNIFVNIDQTGIERTGHVTVNGDELTPKQMRRISAYVQQVLNDLDIAGLNHSVQVDMFIGTLTVREQLQFSVRSLNGWSAGSVLRPNCAWAESTAANSGRRGSTKRFEM